MDDVVDVTVVVLERVVVVRCGAVVVDVDVDAPVVLPAVDGGGPVTGGAVVRGGVVVAVGSATTGA